MKEKEKVRNRIQAVNKELKYIYTHPAPPKGLPPKSVSKVTL